MAHSPNNTFDQETLAALDAFALEPGEERLRAPVNAQGQVEIIKFGDLGKLTVLEITVSPDAIRVSREDGEPFGIADHSHNQSSPVLALGQHVTSLVVERHADSWVMKQSSDWHVDVNSHDSLGRFWQTLWNHAQRARMKRALQNGQAIS